MKNKTVLAILCSLLAAAPSCGICPMPSVQPLVELDLNCPWGNTRLDHVGSVLRARGCGKESFYRRRCGVKDNGFGDMVEDECTCQWESAPAPAREIGH